MISKELLSEVFGVEVKGEILVQKEYDEMNGGELEWDVICFNFSKYPLHYVAHKCKEWAYENEFDIRSYVGKYQDSNTWFGSVLITSINFEKLNHRGFVEFTESEAIFKACQWILDNKGTK